MRHAGVVSTSRESAHPLCAARSQIQDVMPSCSLEQPSAAALMALLAGPFGARCLETAARGWSNQLHSLQKDRAAEHFDPTLLLGGSEVAGRRSRCSLSAISCMHGIGVLPPKSVSNTSGWA